MRQADRLIINILTNYGLTALGIVANLLMVPVVISQLGRSGFGLANMILAVVGVFDLLSNSVGRALERFIPQSLAEHDQARLGRMFNTALVAFVLIGLLGAGCLLAIRGWLTSEASAGLGFESDAMWSCWLLVAYMVVGYPWTCYQKVLGAMQRYDLVGFFVGASSLARMIIVIFVFWTGHGTISFFIGSLLLALMVANILCRSSLRRLTPDLSESIRQVDRATVRSVGSFSAATLLIVVGNILVTQGYTLFVGKTLGMRELGGLAAVLTVRTLLWTLINNVAGVLTPAVSSLEAHGSEHNIAKLFLSGAKYSSMMAVMICGVPIVIAGPFIELWLGAEFKGLNYLLYMLLIVQIPLSPGLTSQQILVGLGHVKATGKIVFSRGLLAILSALAYVEWVSPSLEGSAACVFGMQLAGAVSLFLFASSVTRLRWHRALLEVLGRPILLGAVGGAVTWLVSSQLGVQSWWKLLAAAGAGETVFLALALTIGFNSEEKAKLYSFAGRVKNRMMPTLDGAVSATEGEP